MNFKQNNACCSQYFVVIKDQDIPQSGGGLIPLKLRCGVNFYFYGCESLEKKVEKNEKLDLYLEELTSISK